LRIQNKGFNIYVSGHAGSGRKTALRRYLLDLAKEKPTAGLVLCEQFQRPVPAQCHINACRHGTGIQP
jgi:ABC-type ATPase involved in cell division